MTLVHNVVGPPTATRLIMLVHGFGADENDLAALLPYLDPEGRFVAVLPRGPIQIPGMPGYSWFDIEGVTGDSEQPPPGFVEHLDALDALLDAVCEERGLGRDDAVSAGFSMGGAMAIALAYRRSTKTHPSACLAMSSYFPEGIDYDWDAGAAIPALVEHGTNDPLIPVERGRHLAQTLQDRGVPTTYAEYPMEHQIALESIQRAHEWLLEVGEGKRPNEAIGTFSEPLVKPVTTAQWQREVVESDLPVIVDFWAPWCGPCRQVSPIVEQIAAMREGSYKVVKVNIDEEPRLAQEFNVQSIPMIGLFRSGRLERSAMGAKPRPQLEAELGMLVIP